MLGAIKLIIVIEVLEGQLVGICCVVLRPQLVNQLLEDQIIISLSLVKIFQSLSKISIDIRSLLLLGVDVIGNGLGHLVNLVLIKFLLGSFEPVVAVVCFFLVVPSLDRFNSVFLSDSVDGVLLVLPLLAVTTSGPDTVNPGSAQVYLVVAHLLSIDSTTHSVSSFKYKG